MTEVWSLAALWLGLALVATMLSIWLGVATALSEIVVGTVAQLLIGVFVGRALLGTGEPWVTFLSGTGAIILTFLAGAELDPVVFRTKWKETTGIGLVGFFAPFLGCSAFAFYVLGWTGQASWLAGVALSTTSVAVVYAVMLELGLNSTGFGKAVLAACFVNDLGTVIALGLIFAPFTLKTVAFVGVSIVVLSALPWVTPRFFRLYGGRPSELEAKFLLLALFGMGALAAWAESEAVLRAGSFVSVPALVAAPVSVLGLLFAKLITKTVGVWPVTRFFRYPRQEAAYTTLLMSTGLTFGSISALFGLTHKIIDQAQYSFLIAAVIGSAVLPTLVANAFFLPRYLLPKAPAATEALGTSSAGVAEEATR